MHSLPEQSATALDKRKLVCIELLNESQQVVASLIAKTTSSRSSKSEPQNIESILQACITEISKITNITISLQDFDDIVKYGKIFKQKVEHIKNSEPGFTEAFTCLCVLSKWLDSSLSYIKNENNKDTRCILNAVSPQWQQIFFTDESQSDDINENFFADDSNDFSDNVFELLASELKNITENLNDLYATIVYGEDDQLIDAITEYITLVECLSEAARSIGLQGISTVCNFIIENITIFSSYSLQQRELKQHIVQPWIKLLIEYLSEPIADDKCLNIVNYLENKDWPNPLMGNAWRELFTELSCAANIATNSVDENTRKKIAKDSDVLLNIAADARPEVVEAFMQEAPQLAAELATHLDLIQKNINLGDNIEAAQRVSHSLKGSANLISIKGIANLAHNLEDIFELLLIKKINILPKTLTITLQESSDCIESMIDAVLGKSEIPVESRSVLQSILNWVNKLAHNDLTEQASIATSSTVTVVVKQSPVTSTTMSDYIRIPTFSVEEMYRLVGEVSISLGQIKTKVRQLLRQSETYQQHNNIVQERRFELENLIDIRDKKSIQHSFYINDSDRSEFDALEMDHYDELYSISHRYIEAVADSREISQFIHSEIIHLDGLFLQQSRLNKELENVVNTTRLVPVSSIESRLYRNVRQVCRATDKQAELELFGVDLMLDAEVLNKLVNPLMHLLRNAVDHGIESSPQRLALHKNPIGKIVIKFSYDGNHVMVSCYDDGQGLDYDKIRDSAIEKGLLSTLHQASKTELARLILSSGFSTRDITTQISGRGVGMDVVHTTIKQLKGTLELSDSESGGLQINIRLPISLVTNHSLIIKSNNVLLALPTSSITQVLAPGSGDFCLLANAATFQLGKDVYPVRALSTLLNQPETENETNNNKAVILIRDDTGITAVTIDAAVDSYELVVKNSGAYVGKIPGILGISILGDGNVIPVVDVLELLRSPINDNKQNNYVHPSTQNTKPELLQVLIVDDSLSVRKSLTQLVEDAGYQPITAIDGIDAISLMEKQQPDIALIDMEMPRMNGLELTQHIRGNSIIKDLPIIMITSRAQQKHRQHATAAGVNVYVTKPYTEDKLLDEIILLTGA